LTISISEKYGENSAEIYDIYELIFINILGGCVVWPHMIAFIDDNSKQGQSSLLIAINLTVALIGPIIAFLMAGQILNKWVNFTGYHFLTRLFFNTNIF